MIYRAVFTLGPVHLATDIPGPLDPGQPRGCCLHGTWQLSVLYNQLLFLTRWESSVNLCPAVGHGFLTSATVPGRHGPCGGTYSSLGQCVPVKTALYSYPRL